jgi:hypothetical protein
MIADYVITVINEKSSIYCVPQQRTNGALTDCWFCDNGKRLKSIPIKDLVYTK